MPPSLKNASNDVQLIELRTASGEGHATARVSGLTLPLPVAEEASGPESWAPAMCLPPTPPRPLGPVSGLGLGPSKPSRRETGGKMCPFRRFIYLCLEKKNE